MSADGRDALRHLLTVAWENDTGLHLDGYACRGLLAVVESLVRAAPAPPPERAETDADAAKWRALPDCPDCGGAGGFGPGGFDSYTGEWQGEKCERCDGKGKDVYGPASAPPPERAAPTPSNEAFSAAVEAYARSSGTCHAVVAAVKAAYAVDFPGAPPRADGRAEPTDADLEAAYIAGVEAALARDKAADFHLAGLRAVAALRATPAANTESDPK